MVGLFAKNCWYNMLMNFIQQYRFTFNGNHELVFFFSNFAGKNWPTFLLRMTSIRSTINEINSSLGRNHRQWWPTVSYWQVYRKHYYKFFIIWSSAKLSINLCMYFVRSKLPLLQALTHGCSIFNSNTHIIRKKIIKINN